MQKRPSAFILVHNECASQVQSKRAQLGPRLEHLYRALVQTFLRSRLWRRVHGIASGVVRVCFQASMEPGQMRRRAWNSARTPIGLEQAPGSILGISGRGREKRETTLVRTRDATCVKQALQTGLDAEVLHRDHLRRAPVPRMEHGSWTIRLRQKIFCHSLRIVCPSRAPQDRGKRGDAPRR